MLGKRRRRRFWFLWSSIAALLIAAAGVSTWLAANPAIAAFLCPACFGLERLDGRIYVERSLKERDRVRLQEQLAAARRNVSDVLGTLRADPVLLVCASEACDRSLGGRGTRAAAYGWHFARVSPRGRNAAVLAHELTHTEFHWRVGARAMLTGAFPAWFDEGLAVLISRDPRFLDISAGGSPRCKGEWSEQELADLPQSVWQWMREAGETRNLYTRAACMVARWYAAVGRQGLLELIGELAAGEDFATAFARDRSRRLPAAPVPPSG